MTSSWRPSTATVEAARTRYPGINHNREWETFRDWHIAQGTTARTGAQWDALFLTWCARKQTAHEDSHPNGGVENDPVTGMPINPRPRTRT